MDSFSLSQSTSTSRLASIDAARGAAMVFVCLAHFASFYHFATGSAVVGGYLIAIGMIATPTFVSVSGTVAGFMFAARRKSFPHFQRKLLDRGAFLLLVGHAVLALTGFLSGAGFTYTYRIGYITDAIAIAIIFGPYLVQVVAPGWRLVLATGLLVADWLAIFFLPASAGVSGLSKHYLLGVLNPGPLGIDVVAFPIVPWFALYLVGTVIGQKVGLEYSRQHHARGHIVLAKAGLAAFALGSIFKVTLIVARDLNPSFNQLHSALVPLLSSYQKYPPGPAYLLFYSGAGLLLIALVLEAERRRHMTWLLRHLQQVGQASLFSYVAQFHLYAVLLQRLRVPYTPFWPLIFLLTLAILAIAATAWNSVDGNRFLTVGILPVLERRARRRRLARDREVPLVRPVVSLQDEGAPSALRPMRQDEARLTAP